LLDELTDYGDHVDPLLYQQGHVVETNDQDPPDLEGFQMISLGWTNPTPWNTFRELPENELAKRADELVAKVTDPSRTIFNFHAPPCRVQPLLGLHGHIYESRGAERIGRTLALNPGSSYEEGVLQGALVTLDPKKAKIKTTCWSTDRTDRNSRHSWNCPRRRGSTKRRKGRPG